MRPLSHQTERAERKRQAYANWELARGALAGPLRHLQALRELLADIVIRRRFPMAQK